MKSTFKVLFYLKKGSEKKNGEVIGKATQLCPFWPRRIIPFGYNMIDPFG